MKHTLANCLSNERVVFVNNNIMYLLIYYWCITIIIINALLLLIIFLQRKASLSFEPLYLRLSEFFISVIKPFTRSGLNQHHQSNSLHLRWVVLVRGYFFKRAPRFPSSSNFVSTFYINGTLQGHSATKKGISRFTWQTWAAVSTFLGSHRQIPVKDFNQRCQCSKAVA